MSQRSDLTFQIRKVMIKCNVTDLTPQTAHGRSRANVLTYLLFRITNPMGAWAGWGRFGGVASRRARATASRCRNTLGQGSGSRASGASAVTGASTRPGGVSVCRLGRHLSRRLCRTSRHCGSRRRRHLQLLKRAAPSKASEREGGGGGVDRVVLGGGGGGDGIRGPSLSFRGRLCEPAPPPLRSLPPPC